MALDPVPAWEKIAPTTQTPTPPYKFAYIIDGSVVMVLATDAKTAAIITSEPQIVQVDTLANVQEGMIYDATAGTFSGVKA
jgi:hypothetical protein